MQITPPLAAVLAAAVILGGCGSSTHTTSRSSTTSHSSTPTSAAPATAGSTAVKIANYAYAPANLTVKAGTKVTFTNHDATAHTATATGALSFDTGTVKPGASGSVTLTKPGTYSYICQFHPFMKGTITVTG